jgi:hypothetical protein
MIVRVKLNLGAAPTYPLTLQALAGVKHEAFSEEGRVARLFGSECYSSRILFRSADIAAAWPEVVTFG